MPSLTIAARIRTPAPLEGSVVCFGHDGRRGAAWDERGRLWIIDADPSARTAEARPLPIVIARPPVEELRHGDLSGSHGLARLLARGADGARVIDAATGEVVADVGALPGRCACLSPDGRRLIALDEEAGWSMDVDAPRFGWRSGASFYVEEEPYAFADTEGWTEEEIDRRELPPVRGLYLDHVDDVLAHPWPLDSDGTGDELVLAAACYGFVATHVACAMGDGGVARVGGRSRTFGGLVYDPTELARPWGERHVFVVHGYGTGVSALDPVTGESFAFPTPDRAGYCHVHAVVPCGTAPIAWVRTKAGAFLWRVGAEAAPMPDAPGRILALYPDALLCADGGELVWVGIL